MVFANHFVRLSWSFLSAKRPEQLAVRQLRWLDAKIASGQAKALANRLGFDEVKGSKFFRVTTYFLGARLSLGLTSLFCGLLSGSNIEGAQFFLRLYLTVASIGNSSSWMNVLLGRHKA